MLETISDNVCAFMMRIDTGISWMALRNAIGKEREKNYGDRGAAGWSWVRFLASRKDTWMKWVNKVRASDHIGRK